jgi:hypothetical protein
VLLFLLRHSYGFNRKDMDMAASLNAISKGTGLHRTHVCRIISQLRASRIITSTDKPTIYGDLACYRIEKDYGKWVVANPATGSSLATRLGSSKSGNKGSSKSGNQERHKRKTYIVDSEKPDRPSQKPAREKKATDPNVSKFLSWWATEYKAMTGSPYLVNGAKEGSLVKRMLGTFGYDRLESMAGAFLVSEDAFVQKAGRTLGVMASQVNKLAQTCQAETDYDIIPSEQFLRGAHGD